MSGQSGGDRQRDISYDPERNQYSVEFDRARDVPSIVLVGALAEIEGRDTNDIEPLYGTVDPDAIDTIFQRDSRTTAERNGHLTFDFDGRTVTVWAEGRIDISLSDAERDGADTRRDETDENGAEESEHVEGRRDDENVESGLTDCDSAEEDESSER
ncbi:HalOD1 output domain-containing protein [Haloprofundus sp. MHR1]|uniref:HalOD1 output domain-containing protein n=1 Tax=Haloprofundus sp. MHR1 TaxID=2572921 RepID=UPI0010BF3026|nr:HalOD1 output domain-containing protein [Haloprofundus sp. MHR1]QCJ45640.1 hypothetical protein FCF25_00175 [Haloprofundus sp. MHR1]